MLNSDLYFIRWIYKRDGTVWKQLYNEEPVLTDERGEGTEVLIKSEKPPRPEKPTPKPTFPPLFCKRCGRSWTPPDSEEF